MSSSFMDTSNTNYLEMESSMGDKINEGIANLDRSNAEMFQRMANDAIEAANTRSRNFQKFGELVKQTGQFKKEVDAWNKTRELDQAYKDENLEKDRSGETTETKDFGGGTQYSKDGMFYTQDGVTYSVATGGAVTVQQQKQERAERAEEQKLQVEENTNEKNGIELIAEAYRNSDKPTITQLESDNALAESMLAASTSNNLAARATELERSFQDSLPTFYQTKIQIGNMEKPMSVYELQKAGRFREARAAQLWWTKSFYMLNGVYERGSDGFLPKRYRLELNKKVKAFNDQIHLSSVNSRFEQNKKALEWQEKSGLVFDIQNIGVSAIVGDGTENSGFIAKHLMETGQKDPSFAMGKVYEHIEWGSSKGFIKAADITKIRNEQFELKQGGTGTLKDIGNGQLDSMLGALEKKLRIQEVKDMEAEKDAKILEKVNETVASMESITNTPDGRISEADKNTMLGQVAQELNLPVTDSRLKQIDNFLTAEDKDDIETTRQIDYDLNKYGYLENKNMRLNEINDQALRKKYKQIVDDADVLAQNKDVIKEYEGLIDGDVYGRTVSDGYKKAELGADYATMSLYAKRDFREKFKQYEKGSNANDAARRAYSEVKTKIEDKEGETQVSRPLDQNPYLQDGTAPKYTENYEKDKANALNMLAKDPIGTLNSDQYLPGEKAAALQGMKYREGKAQIPEYYLTMAKPLKFTTAHELLEQRLMKLGLIDEDGMTVPPEKTIGLGMDTLEKFTHFPEGKAIRGMWESSFDYNNGQGIMNDRLYAAIEPKGANGDLNFNGTIPKGREKIKVTDRTILELLSAHKVGYNGFGRFGLDAQHLFDEQLLKAAGVDYTDPFTEETQKRLVNAIMMRNMYTRNIFNISLSDNKYRVNFDTTTWDEENGKEKYAVGWTLDPTLYDLQLE